jgi:hypothetical protein
MRDAEVHCRAGCKGRRAKKGAAWGRGMSVTEQVTGRGPRRAGTKPHATRPDIVSIIREMNSPKGDGTPKLLQTKGIRPGAVEKMKTVPFLELIFGGNDR